VTILETDRLAIREMTLWKRAMFANLEHLAFRATVKR